MDAFYLIDGLALADATDLMRRYGAEAGVHAAARAGRSRNVGNISRFCHWRQIERAIAVLRGEQVTGTVH